MHDLSVPCVHYGPNAAEFRGIRLPRRPGRRNPPRGPVWRRDRAPDRLDRHARSPSVGRHRARPGRRFRRPPAGGAGPRLPRSGGQFHPGRAPARRPAHRGLRPARLSGLPPRPTAQHARSTATSTTCWRSSTGGPRWWSDTATEGTSPSGPRSAPVWARGSSRWWPTSRRCPGWASGPAVPPVPPPCGRSATGGTGRAGATRRGHGAEAERFFRRMVGDAAWERLSEAAKEDRRADGPALEAELAAIRITDQPFDVTALAVPATFGPVTVRPRATGTPWPGWPSMSRAPSGWRSQGPRTGPT